MVWNLAQYSSRTALSIPCQRSDRTFPADNTHGSICEINGQWYVFYHRQTGTDEFARQAMVAPITVKVEDGKVLIDQELCVGCGVCKARCDFDAIQIKQTMPMRADLQEYFLKDYNLDLKL